MKRQEFLDFRGERRVAHAVWKQLPEVGRKQAVALWARLIAVAVQRGLKPNGVVHDPADL